MATAKIAKAQVVQRGGGGSIGVRMTYQDAIEQLSTLFGRKDTPQRVIDALFQLFHVPGKLVRVVFDNSPAGHASQLSSRLEPSDALLKLCAAARVGTPDWDEFFVDVKHLLPSERREVLKSL